MSLSPFDVVVVPFPYSDTLAEKRRPAVVVSSMAAIAETGQVWVAMVTSTSKAAYGDVELTDLSAAGLPRACRVRAGKLATLDVERVLRRAGGLCEVDREAAARALALCAGW